MRLYLIIAIIGFLATNAHAHAKGINCKGSAMCSIFDKDSRGGWNDTHSHASTIVKYLDKFNDTTWIVHHEPIACVASICAFIKGTEGMFASEVKDLSQKIVRHGCHSCGSAPRGYPQTNDNSNGELTFNYRLWGCRNMEGGVCPYFWWEDSLQQAQGDSEVLEEW